MYQQRGGPFRPKTSLNPHSKQNTGTPNLNQPRSSTWIWGNRTFVSRFEKLTAAVLESNRSKLQRLAHGNKLASAPSGEIIWLTS